jgi:FkbH-like protein
MRRIAKKLNIGLDSLVFVDDSQKEIGEVQSRVPEVTCLLVPEDVSYLPDLLGGTDLFDFAEVTDEDRKRTEMMATEQVRQQLQETLSEADFKEAMGLKIDVFQAEKQHIARLAQLINKTNQFNLTTRRRTQDEVEALAEADNFLLLGMEIKDKYGDYGLVGATVLEKKGAVCRIDTMLMSCRVLGRDAETVFIAKLAEAAKSLGCDTLLGDYISTPKNDMVRDLYAKHGFRQQASGSWQAALKDIPGAPAHVKVTLTLRTADRKRA